MTEVTELMARVRSGDREAFDELCATLYDELHALAFVQRSRWEGDLTMGATAIAHEAYLKLASAVGSDWRDRAHFLAVAALAMRQVLLNYAQKRRARKRGGATPDLRLDEVNPAAPEIADEVLALDDALERLERISPRRTRVVEYRFFVGLQTREIAEVLGISSSTVEREWALASAWLRAELEEV